MNTNNSLLEKYIPMLGWLKNYNITTAKGDLNAGITVGIMLIPQGMAYALLAGMPPIYGLYASIVPLLVYAVLGTSRQLAVGPVAMISLLVLAGIGAIAEPGSDRFIQLAILTALGVGLFQFAMGLLRMGFLVNFLSHPVLSGFTSAAAIIIGGSQIKNLFGISVKSTNQLHELVWAIAQKLSEIDLITTAIGVGSILTIVFIRKWKRTFPSALVVVALGTLITAFFGLDAKGVSVVGTIPKGLPSFEIMNFSWADIKLIFPTVLVISLVGYMESIAVAKAIANKHGYKVDPNQELIGLGMANVAGSFFQAFPTTGGFSRTAVNDQAGSQTGMASIISASIIALTVLFLTPLFYYLPSAVLAAIIIVAVAGLFDAKEMKHLWQTDKKDLLMLAITFAATLFLGMEEGIALGVLISLLAVVYSSTRPHSAELGKLDSSDNFRNVNRYKNAVTKDETLVFRFDAQLYFANSDFFKDRIDSLIQKKGASLQTVILDFSVVNNIDSTGIHVLEKLQSELLEKDIDLCFASVIGPVRDKFMISGLVDKIGKQNFYFDVVEAENIRVGIDNKVEAEKASPIQSNI